ncbi:MAG: dihydroneopterin aldolase [Spiribacter salinus]|jgi:dihydroneopterin aldolase|uniref:7,8-dihydroneopterin aldolase n=1 Tax=Spiribacter salinus TaxID=1335746 RepID=A0A540VTE3_9GAMM|nr:MAG: dihydroneopterin aldolase [Spiribacter salinus]
MDTVFLQGLELRSVIGVHAWERAFAQRLKLDLRLAVDTRAAAASDDLADAVDYAGLAEQLTQTAAAADCQLIEALADRLAATVLSHAAIQSVDLTLHKPGALPAATDVGVAITRSQQEAS